MSTALTPRQLKQIEKQNRRRKYADLAIQGTNNSSIASKRSVEALYLSKMSRGNDSNERPNEYFKHFVKKTPKRSPCINRGYWLRLHAIRSRLDSIVEATSKKIVVVNLGCGYDPLPFQFLDQKNPTSRKYLGRISFLDIDYPDLIDKKIEVIRQTNELLNILGPEIERKVSSARYVTNNYIAASCDLNYPDSYKDALTSFGLEEPDLIKVFVAEVSLAYMRADRADEIIALCGQLPNSHFLMLEQLIPEDENEPFSKQMLKHFRKNDSPLLSVLKYKTQQSQEERFTRLGFPNINAGDMFKLWESVDAAEKRKVQSVESFDELEEFHLFCHHYIICHATNDVEFVFDVPYKFSQPKLGGELSTVNEVGFQKLKFSIARKFGAAGTVEQDDASSFLYFGGSNPSRLNELIQINKETGEHAVLNFDGCPPARMCATFTSLGNQEYLLIGGRQSPSNGFSDTWILNTESNAWRQGPALPEPRYRHATCRIRDKLLVCGGATKGSSFLLYDLADQTFNSCVAPETDLNRPLVSAALDYYSDTGTGVIVGGSVDETTVSDTLYTFICEDNAIKITKKISHPLLQRYGAKAKIINNHTVLVVGGTSPGMLFGQDSSILMVDTEKETIRGLNIHPDIWRDHPLFLVGFELVQVSRHVFLVLGGGATCYGFGAVNNYGFMIDVSNIMNGS